MAVLLLIGLVALTRVPFRFDWLGEQDQGRFLVDAMLYRWEGGSILRTYFIYTSPLCLAGFALLSKLFGNASLLIISNDLGVLCGILTTLAAYGLLRSLSVGRLWAGSAAFTSSLVPGVFMTSLYGYPSVYALPLGIAAAAAASRAVTREDSLPKVRWWAVAALAYCLFVLLKVDFALLGTLLLAVVVLHRRVTLVNILILATIALIAVASWYAAIALMSDPKTTWHFAAKWTGIYKPYTQISTGLGTIWLAVGVGTLFLLVAGFVMAFIRGESRFGLVTLIAWLIAVVPLWSFWGSIPPISTRHAMPGALVTTIFLGLLIAKLYPHKRIVALALPLLVVLGNWLWGTPSFDLNYHLSGNLVESLRINRRAFAACRRVADQIAGSEKRMKILFGNSVNKGALDDIDILPMIRYELARRAIEVRNQPPASETPYGLQTICEDGSEFVFIYCPHCGLLGLVRSVENPARDIAVSSVTFTEYPSLHPYGIHVDFYNLDREFENSDL